jgi:hypothetical protein
MSDRHELFDELEAFDPDWQTNYRNLEQAVLACSNDTPYVIDLWSHFVSTEERSVDGVPDILSYIEECQKAEEESPFFQKAMGTLDRMAGDGQREEWS